MGFKYMLPHFAQVDDDVRLEDDWVPMDEQLDPSALEEVIREKQAHSSAVVLESVSYILLLELFNFFFLSAACD